MSSMAQTNSTLLLDADLAGFIQGGVAIALASANAQRVPSIGRALGCRVDALGRSVELFLIASKSPTLLDDLRTGHAVAVTFTKPSSHRTLQIKAHSARLLPARVEDRAVVSRYLREFTADVGAAMGGSREALVFAALGQADEINVRVVLEPAAIYEQTPGPRAGQWLDT